MLQLCATMVLAQISGVVVNKSSGQPVPYANIWIEGENIGISSEEDGSFRLNVKAVDYAKKYLITSCMGYVTLRSEVSDSIMKVELSPTSYLLKEVFLFQAKNTSTTKIGLLDRNHINRWLGAISPEMIAHFYPYTDDFKKFPFLKKIILVSDSKINTAQFHLRLFEVSAAGEPGNDLIEPLIGYGVKGKNYVTVDLTDQNFRVPEKGFFVACEWLILDRNKSFTKMYKGQTAKKDKVVSYEPFIGSTLPGKDSGNWLYQSGIWKRTYDVWDGKKLNKDLPIEAPLFQLLLSN